MPFKKLFLTVFSLCIYVVSSAQELLPFVENFTKSEYTGDNQVWNVVQGNDNAMYFANHHYFLRYNGVKWEKYSLPNKTIIRSVFVDGDRVYCGSYKEFGYWKRIKGRMEYFSLSGGTNLFVGNADNEEIWKIFRHNGKMYFQSFNEIYIHDGKTTVKVKFPELISYCYLVDGKIYVATVRNGIYIMEGSTFTKVQNWAALNGNIIHWMEKREGLTYIFTKNNGVFIDHQGTIMPWQNSINDIIKGDVIVTAKFIDNNTLAIGTGLQGLYIINIKEGTYRNINRNNSLKNNAVLSLALDKENDLWLGLDNGISHIEVNSPVSIFSDNSGILGSVYSLATMNNGYLFVTNHGIFSYQAKKLFAIPNSQGQVWDIYKSGNEFIIGHNDGTFVYNGAGLKRVNPVNGGWKFLKSDYDRVYFQANYSGIAVYKDINDLSQWKILDSITKPIRNIAQNRAGELWAADNYRSLYRITYDKDFVVSRVENISRSNQINSDFGVKIFNFRNEILFLINNTWYVYNGISNKLEKNKVFNTVFSNISDIIPVDDNNFMVIKDGLLYLISQAGNDFVWKLLPEKYYQGKLIMENTKAYNNNGQLLINLDDGFIAFEAGREKIKNQKISIEAFYQGNLVDAHTKIKYNQPVEINVVAEYFGFNRPDLFYKLNGSKNLQQVKNGYVILNNLNSGTQELEIYYNNGKKNVKMKAYEFYVAKPWYFSIWMIVVYIVVISGIFFLYYRWNKVRYQEKIKLNEEELKHRKQILELEMEAENKLRKQEYEKHMLEMEVQNKASEVAGKSLSIAKHSEMIESIQEALEAESKDESLKSRIRKIIKTNTISKNEWQSFEKNLIKSHEEFVDRLSKKYPALTPKDIKLSIYLKMNLSSKEIAPLMSISFRGVELHRYRLRKKLGISQEESLYKFMISV
jgi:AraC family chitin signaling transcriptional activator